VNLAALAYVWLCAALKRRDRRLTYSVGLLSAEGAALLIGGGNCPLGPFQRSIGDPVPMFELFLPPRAAKAAIPVLTIVTLAGFAGLAATNRSPAYGQGEPAMKVRSALGRGTARQRNCLCPCRCADVERSSGGAIRCARLSRRTWKQPDHARRQHRSR
jgi:hypothetical protein